MCVANGKTPSGVGDELGIARTTIAYWKKSKTAMPNADATRKIAAYFGVSVDYLLTGKENAATENGDGISDKDRLILSLYHQLTDEQKTAFESFLLSLVGKR